MNLQCKYDVLRTYVFALLLENSSLNGVKVGSLQICCIEFEEVKSVDDLNDRQSKLGMKHALSSFESNNDFLHARTEDDTVSPAHAIH